jgi:hypothetical protein
MVSRFRLPNPSAKGQRVGLRDSRRFSTLVGCSADAANERARAPLSKSHRDDQIGNA